MTQFLKKGNKNFKKKKKKVFGCFNYPQNTCANKFTTAKICSTLEIKIHFSQNVFLSSTFIETICLFNA